jgi:hypothetical protein
LTHNQREPVASGIRSIFGISPPVRELKTCFKKVDCDLSGLLHYIDIGDIALTPPNHA